jgi:S-formylglutathione hydrolase
LTPALEVRASYRCHGGQLSFLTHASSVTGTPMNLGVYLPPRAAAQRVPALYFLAGLTCNEETFLIKSGAIGFAAARGLALIAPDTSPRGAAIEGEDKDWDLGLAAGFYVDATVAPWRRHYRMYSYVTNELPALVEEHFALLPGQRGICGHSMGGHGALTIALRQARDWHSLSAFAPICNPVAVPWGEKAFTNYLGADRSSWLAHDASALMRRQPYPGPVLVDQGLEDKFLTLQLRPDALASAARESGQELHLRRHAGYDHSYWFIQSFIGDHIAWHADRLSAR